MKERWRKVIRHRIYETDGPGDVFHVDGNDKLKRWGFAIHGCIDGFSRKILRLRVATTNMDPIVISNYYLDFMSRSKFCPNVLRMDRGNENICCEDLQVFLTGDPESFLYARSVRNQRIEAFWSRLKKFKLSWWISFFKSLEKACLYKPEFDTHREVLIFCFLSVIQNELNKFVLRWNCRAVRQSSDAPGGNPDLLFHCPPLGFQKKGIQIGQEDINIVNEVLGIDDSPVAKNDEMHDLLKCYFKIHNLRMPTDWESALDLYADLLKLLKEDYFLV